MKMWRCLRETRAIVAASLVGLCSIAAAQSTPSATGYLRQRLAASGQLPAYNPKARVSAWQPASDADLHPNVAASSSSPSSELSLGPKITFENGQLSIVAENSTLQQVLDAVREKTGTQVEAPFLDNSKITVQLGPGDPMDIVGKLLYGIRFNYIILDSSSRSQRPDRIIITQRADGAVAVNTTAPVALPTPQVKAAVDQDAISPAASATPDGLPPDQAKNSPRNDSSEDSDKKDDKDKSADNKEPSSDDKATTAQDKKPEADVQQDPAVAALADAPSAEPSAAERMANLPEGMNPAIAALYPSLFGNGSQNGGSSGAPGTNPNPLALGNNAATGQRTPSYTPVPIQYNSAGQPVLPGNIPPEIWNLYPGNLIDLIKSNNPPIQGPITPLIPGSSGNGNGVLWNQGMTPPKH
jgi:hypothetical protein